MREVFTTRYIYFVIGSLILIDTGIVSLIGPMLQFSKELKGREEMAGLGPAVVIRLKPEVDHHFLNVKMEKS